LGDAFGNAPRCRFINIGGWLGSDSGCGPGFDLPNWARCSWVGRATGWFGSDSGCDPSGSGWGDIHMQTFDGVHYDLQAAGEFLALQDRSGAVKMQMRLEPDASKRVSYATAVAAQIDGTKIAIH